jgi:hypothetical protein
VLRCGKAFPRGKHWKSRRQTVCQDFIGDEIADPPSRDTLEAVL